MYLATLFFFDETTEDCFHSLKVAKSVTVHLNLTFTTVMGEFTVRNRFPWHKTQQNIVRIGLLFIFFKSFF